VKYQVLLRSKISQNNSGGKKDPMAQYFDNLDEYEYRAFLISDYNIKRYRHYMENFTVLEVAEIFYAKMAERSMMNG